MIDILENVFGNVFKNYSNNIENVISYKHFIQLYKDYNMFPELINASELNLLFYTLCSNFKETEAKIKSENNKSNKRYIFDKIKSKSKTTTL